MQLEIAVRCVGHRTVLQVAGEIDMATAPDVSQLGASALSDGAAELWIDLSEVEFIDAAGVHALLDLDELAAADGRRLAVISPSGRIRRVLDLAGATEHLRIFESRFDAHRLT